MVEVGVSQLRANLPAYLDRVQSGEEIRITRRGRTVAVLRAPAEVHARNRETLAELRVRARVGDVIEPVDSSWEADDPA